MPPMGPPGRKSDFKKPKNAKIYGQKQALFDCCIYNAYFKHGLQYCRILLPETDT